MQRVQPRVRYCCFWEEPTITGEATARRPRRQPKPTSGRGSDVVNNDEIIRVAGLMRPFDRGMIGKVDVTGVVSNARRLALGRKVAVACLTPRRERRSFSRGSGWHELNRPIRGGPAARRAVMPGDEIDGRGLDGLAAFATEAAQQIFKGHIAIALHQEPHGIADRIATAVLAVQLDHALRPVR
jgi:hypothetical protein